MEIDMEKTFTLFVLVSDLNYFNRAELTIQYLRSVGLWKGQILLITLDDLNLSEDFKKKYTVMEKKFPSIDKKPLLDKISPYGFKNSDMREIYKLNQWEKLHVFDEYFKKWKRIIYLDAGLRIFDSVEHLLELDYKNSFVCPNDCGDGPIKQTKRFSCQLDYADPKLIENVEFEFGKHIFDSEYFLNCIWIYDTKILDIVTKNELIDIMYRYPFCRTNEMGVMNLIIHFKHKLWKPFPHLAKNGKFLFDWCELNNPGTHWSQYCFLKYPAFIN